VSKLTKKIRKALRWPALGVPKGTRQGIVKQIQNALNKGTKMNYVFCPKCKGLHPEGDPCFQTTTTQAAAKNPADRLVVCRPANAQLAIETATRIARMQKENGLSPEKAAARFQQMILEQDYTFVGYLGENGKTVEDEIGNHVGTINPGDSFCKMKTVPHAQSVHLDEPP
jgi:hypothetical protein